MKMDKSITKIIDGRQFTIRVKHEYNWRVGKKARAHVSNESDKLDAHKALDGFAEVMGADTIYTATGKFPALDKAWNAFNSIIVDSKTADLKTALTLICDAPEEVKMRFSRTAGCKCGCSPGFILDGFGNNVDIFVDVGMVEMVSL